MMHEYSGNIDYWLGKEVYSAEECQYIALQLGALAAKYQDFVTVSMTASAHEWGAAGVDDSGSMTGRVRIDAANVPADCWRSANIDLSHLQYQFESSLSSDVARKLQADLAGVDLSLERAVIGPDLEIHRYPFAPDDEVAFAAWMNSLSQR